MQCSCRRDSDSDERASVARGEEELLHAPVRGLGDVDLGLRTARELVRAGELAEVSTGTADHTQHLALERHFE